MSRMQATSFTVLSAVTAFLLAAPGIAAEAPFEEAFANAEAVRGWATKSFFGGAHLQAFSRGGKEFLVVNGMPTSGLLTSQLVFFGRSAPTGPYRVVLATGVFRADAKAAEDDRGVVVSANGKILVVVPFDILALAAWPTPVGGRPPNRPLQRTGLEPRR